MLNRITYKAKFKQTGKTIKGDIEFNTGLSSITGANETGKSMVLELTRWALFGSKALRAPTSSYELIDVTLTFTVKDIQYVIKRSLSNGMLSSGGKAIASGTTSINEKIIQIFGYGLNVFDIAHHCKQGDVEALSNMGGADRKKMIDRVIGMDALDTAAASVGEDAKELRTSIKATELALGPAPSEPVKPVKYKPVIELKAELARLRPLAQEKQRLQAWLDQADKIEEPVIPPYKVDESSDDLHRYQENRRLTLMLQEDLRRQIGGVQPTTWTEADLAEIEEEIRAYDRHLMQEAYRRQHGEPPKESESDLVDLESAWYMYNNKVEVEGRLARLKANSTTCPACTHTWAHDQAAVASLEHYLSEYGAIDEPSIPQDEVARRLKASRAWAGRDIVPQAPPPRLSALEIREARRAMALEPLRKQLEAIVVPPDRSNDLIERRSYEAAMATYDKAKKTWDQTVIHRVEVKALMKEIGYPADEIRTIEEDFLPGSMEYEALLAAYKEAHERHRLATSTLADKRADLEQLVAAAEAVKLLRSKIKAYLVPSLNVAASDLISRMTGGQRTLIAVDENFENILVDGQSIDTLSGSGKAVANLAIRLGLGQVLTNKVFSVFLGDEIDASMDADRADYTAECLKGLNSVIKQIILVSHKDLDVQHRITINA